MTDRERIDVTEAFASLFYYFHRSTPPDRVLQMYLHDVQDLPHAAVIRAMQRLRMEPKRRTMPLPSEIIALVRPEQADDMESMANAIAGKIVSTVSAVGYSRPALAKEKLGDLAWRVVQAKGGWLEICTSLRAADTGFFAQCRDLARSFISQDKMQYNDANVLPSSHPDATKTLSSG